MTRALKLWFSVALVVVFSAGVATGLFAGARHGKRVFVAGQPHFTGDRMREHLRRELQLTPEQEQNVAPVIERAAAELDAIRQETQQRVAKTMNDSHQEIAPLLNSDQRERLSQMRDRHIRFLRRRHLGPPPPEQSH
jgi:hypothetical protein